LTFAFKQVFGEGGEGGTIKLVEGFGMRNEDRKGNSGTTKQARQEFGWAGRDYLVVGGGGLHDA